MLRRRKKHGPIGLDIGACGIKMVQFSEEGSEAALMAVAHCPILPTADDPVSRSGAIERAIAEALRQHPFQGRRVVTALACREFQTKNIRLPRMPEEEKASAIEFEAQDRFGAEGTVGQIRHITAGEVRHGDELKEEIMVFAAQESVLQARLKTLASLKLEPVAIDIAPCAVARCFFRFLRRAEDTRAVNVFLDLGYRGTTIVLTRGTELSFLKTIDVGGEHLNQAVVKALSISREEAAELRTRIMSEKGGQRAGDRKSLGEEVKATVKDAVRPLIERISRDVQLCLRYFAVTFRGQRPSILTLVGGEAHEPSALEIISEQADVPCSIGNPFRGVPRLGPIGARDQRSFLPAWAVACGLALRGSRWIQVVGSEGAGAASGQPAAAGV